MKGWLFPAEMDLERVKRSAEAVDMREEVFRLVSPREPITYEGGPLKVLLIDAGAKDNIVRSLVASAGRCCAAPRSASPRRGRR